MNFMRSSLARSWSRTETARLRTEELFREDPALSELIFFLRELPFLDLCSDFRNLLRGSCYV
jgi:hypothetical protein